MMLKTCLKLTFYMSVLRVYRDWEDFMSGKAATIYAKSNQYDIWCLLNDLLIL